MTSILKTQEQILFSWSGGKDSAMALKCLLGEDRYNIVSLITTVTEDYSRVSMHGFRRSLLEAQALSLGIPLYEIIIPAHCTDTDYAQKMLEAMNHWKQRGVTAVAFGDIHLADIRTYREEKLSSRRHECPVPPLGNKYKGYCAHFS